MSARIDYKASVAGDLRRLDKKTRIRVIDAIERDLRSGPSRAEPLSGEFAGLWRLRVGDYRVVFARTEAGYLILRIGHRREVYR